MDWHNAAPSWKDSSDNHRFFLTARSRIYVTIVGPPKAVSPSRKNARKSRHLVGPSLADSVRVAS
jgi:hypothetical protein